MMGSQERVLKINKVICTTKSRIIHSQISVSKQYKMMMSSVARVKFIKTKVIFKYHAKSVSNQVLSSSDNKIKSYSCSNFTTKIWKTKIWKFSGLQNGAMRGLKIGAGFRDYKSGQGGFQNGAGITNRWWTNAYDDDADFEICEFHKSTEI